MRRLGEDQLRDVLGTELGPCREFGVTVLEGGHSRTQALVTWNDARYVVVLSDGETAWRCLETLSATPVPVPDPVARIDDSPRTDEGETLFVRRYVPGDTVYRSEPDWFAAPDSRRSFARAVVETLGAVHAVDADRFGPDALPVRSPQDAVDRVRATADDLASSHDDRPTDRLGRLGRWLDERVPASSQTRLVHGDFKLDNVIAGPGASSRRSVRAVVDWEHSFLGDHRVDLGYLLVHWRDDVQDPVVPSAVLPRVTARDGYPSRRRLLGTYESVTGLSFDRPEFFLVLALFELACACERIYRRALTADDPAVDLSGLERGMPSLLDRAERVAQGNGAL